MGEVSESANPANLKAHRSRPVVVKVGANNAQDVATAEADLIVHQRHLYNVKSVIKVVYLF